MNSFRTFLLAMAATVIPMEYGFAQTSRADPSLLQNPSFAAAFDMYWRARVSGVLAGNRVCSLENKLYDDPKSPFRPIDVRLKEAGKKFEVLYPRALNDLRRPYAIAPPQSLCSDPKAAWEAIFAFDTAVTALETLLASQGAGR